MQLDYLRLIRTTAVTAFNTYGFKFIPLPMVFFLIFNLSTNLITISKNTRNLALNLVATTNI